MLRSAARIGSALWAIASRSASSRLGFRNGFFQVTAIANDGRLARKIRAASSGRYSQVSMSI
jgi:hypothetical protein